MAAEEGGGMDTRVAQVGLLTPWCFVVSNLIMGMAMESTPQYAFED